MTVRTLTASDNSYTVRIGEQLTGGGGGAPSNLVVGTFPSFFIYGGNFSALVYASTRVGNLVIKSSRVNTIGVIYAGTSILGGCTCAAGSGDASPPEAVHGPRRGRRVGRSQH